MIPAQAGIFFFIRGETLYYNQFISMIRYLTELKYMLNKYINYSDDQIVKLSNIIINDLDKFLADVDKYCKYRSIKNTLKIHNGENYLSLISMVYMDIYDLIQYLKSQNIEDNTRQYFRFIFNMH